MRVAAREGRTLEIRGYTFSDRFHLRLDLCLDLCLSAYGRRELYPVVLAVAQELCLWASLANMRQVFFEERGFDLNDAEAIGEREAEFQTSITRAREQHYRSAVKERGLYLRARVTHNEAGLRIEALNNALHSLPLEDRLRQYLSRAMQYSNIMEYYQDHPADQDGRGVGLALALLMLKEERLRPELLRLGQSGDFTVSRLEIPFDKSYASIRDRIERGEDVRPFASDSLLPADLSGALTMQDLLYVRCPICHNQVDERIFFPEVTADMLNVTRVRQEQIDWQPGSGACACCLATYE